MSRVWPGSEPICDPPLGKLVTFAIPCRARLIDNMSRTQIGLRIAVLIVKDLRSPSPAQGEERVLVDPLSDFGERAETLKRSLQPILNHHLTRLGIDPG